MKSAFSRGLVMAAGLFATAPYAENAIHKHHPVRQSRINKIRDFFAQRQCPAEEYAADFVLAAEQHKLDWRLLPSISFLESTGGKAARNNNILGWGNGETRFANVREGIYLVASRLSRAKHFRGKSTRDKLKTYNANAGYVTRVESTMHQLSPAGAL